MTNKYTISGHRPKYLGGYNDKNPIAKAVIEDIEKWTQALPDNSTVYSGGALGVDQWAAEAAIEQGHSVIFILPFQGFCAKWPEMSQHKLKALIEISGHAPIYTRLFYQSDVYQERNIQLAKHADEAHVWFDKYANGGRTGTANFMKYAPKYDCKVITHHIEDLME